MRQLPDFELMIVTARGTDVNLIPRYQIPRRLIEGAIRDAGALIAVSAALKDILVKLGAPDEKVTVLRNGVDTGLFPPSDLGEGPERHRLGRLIGDYGLSDRVRLLGPRPHTELPALYGAADASVLASSREGCANVLLESMACGTPVVAANIWGNPEVIHAPAGGIIYEPNTPDGIAAAVRRLFVDLPNRAATRAYAKSFSWDETTAGQLALFRRIRLEGRPHPSTRER
jgi:teichuronic acid biosynthesis glycosyltransferase TuaC